MVGGEIDDDGVGPGAGDRLDVGAACAVREREHVGVELFGGDVRGGLPVALGDGETHVEVAMALDERDELAPDVAA